MLTWIEFPMDIFFKFPFSTRSPIGLKNLTFLPRLYEASARMEFGARAPVFSTPLCKFLGLQGS